MIKIVPAILVDNFKELREKIKSVDGFVDLIQIDVMDGRFVNNTTWNNPKELTLLATEIVADLEIHLMIVEPWKYIDEWAKSGAKKIIVHMESFNCDFEKIKKTLKSIKDQKIEAAIAVNPNTGWRMAEPFVKDIDTMFMMTVEPGFGGQEFVSGVLNKISDFKKSFPEKSVEVDGGICIGTAKEATKAGADILAAGNFIFKHPEGARKAIQYLKEDAEIGLAESVFNQTTK